MPRPSLTAVTMVAKLSSVRVMSAAPLATSVPVIPMAQPMSAALRAGASLTPSPVMETISPASCQALTMRILSAGVTRAYTRNFRIPARSSSSLMAASCSPVTASSSLCRIPSCRAMAEAVIT